MNFYRITFAGHRQIMQYGEVEALLEKTLTDLLHTHGVIDCYFGNNGDFDTMAISATRRLKKKHGSDRVITNLVLPYANHSCRELVNQFDTIIIPETLYGVYPKRAITERNRWMIDCTDCLICYIEHSGGAANMQKYANTKKGFAIINLAKEKPLNRETV